MSTAESQTTTGIGLDRLTVWMLVSGLAVVLSGAGIGVIWLLTSAGSAVGIGERWWWVVAGGALLCAIGGWRAARRWSSMSRSTTSE